MLWSRVGTTKVPSTISTSAEPLALAQREGGPEVVDDAVGGRLRDPEQQRELSQCHVGPPVGDDQQHAVLQRQAPRPSPASRDHALLAQSGDERAELLRAQPGERAYPAGLRCRDHGEIISRPRGAVLSYGISGY